MTSSTALSRPSAPSPVQPGDLIVGKYRVERVLGAGGMGVVVAATHVQLRHLVAVKILSPLVATLESAVPRFVQEARVAARIQSDHVVRVFDVGVLPDGPPFMAMDYLEGSDLERLLRQRGAFPVGEVIECLLQACEGIAAAHALGVVHRDLKPSNLVRCERPGAPPLVKIVDFGISKLRPASAGWLDPVTTAPHELIGSPLYASPEQIWGSPDVDERTDVWSLGAVCHTLLAGRPPFASGSLSTLCMQLTEANPERLDRLRPDIPPALADAVRRCMSKDRSRRFQNMADLARALAPFAPPRARSTIERIVSMSPASSRESAPTLVSAADAAPAPVVSSHVTERRASGGRLWVSALALAGGAGLLLALGPLGAASPDGPGEHASPALSSSVAVSAVVAPAPVLLVETRLTPVPPDPVATSTSSSATVRASATPPARKPPRPRTEAFGGLQ